MNVAEASLAELAAAAGLQARTIRSWVAQGLVPGPLSRGPYARYPAETLERVLAIRAMRDLLGMSLAAIRQELLVAPPEKIRSYAAKATELAPETTQPTRQPPPPGAALEYLRALRTDARSANTSPLVHSLSTPASMEPSSPSIGFEGLERRLAEGRGGKPPARKSRAAEWLRIPVTPDVELAIRGRLDDEQRARLERCADLIRDILLGRD